MRFIHCADVHLDRALRGLSIDEMESPRELLTAPRTAFTALVDLAIDERVDFLIIAGDLYDTDWKDYATGRYFVEQCTKLEQAGIQVYLLYGNHDAVQDMKKHLTLPPNVHVFDHRKPQTFVYEREGQRVALHGQSFQSKDVSDNLVAGYPLALPDHVNIGVLHTALTGRPDHEPYAPCTMDDLLSRGYDYFALGHVHQFSIVNEAPWVVFPGNLQGLHVKETGPRGAVAVDIVGTTVERPARIHTDILRWEHLQIDVAHAQGPSDLVALVRRRLSECHASGEGRHQCVRIEIVGEAGYAPALYARGPELREDIKAQALSVSDGKLIIEKLRIRAVSPSVESAAIADALAELGAELIGIGGDPQLAKAIESELQPFLGKLPTQADESKGELLALARRGEFGRVAEIVAPMVRERLLAGDTP